MKDIYNFIISNKRPKNEIYCDAVSLYDNAMVGIIMYDLYKYIHNHDDENNLCYIKM